MKREDGRREGKKISGKCERMEWDLYLSDEMEENKIWNGLWLEGSIFDYAYYSCISLSLSTNR